jgi:hypothetical protein
MYGDNPPGTFVIPPAAKIMGDIMPDYRWLIYALLSAVALIVAGAYLASLSASR